MVIIMMNTYLNAQDKCITDLLTSIAQVWSSIISLIEVGVVLLISCQKVKKLSKMQKPGKFAKAISSKERLSKNQSSVNEIQRT